MSLEENWDLYKTFYEVAKCSSFSKAAEKLYVSQPSISYSIKQLETNLETKLFYRIPSGVKLIPTVVPIPQNSEKENFPYGTPNLVNRGSGGT